jgi:hypothetical protein
MAANRQWRGRDRRSPHTIHVESSSDDSLAGNVSEPLDIDILDTTHCTTTFLKDFFTALSKHRNKDASGFFNVASAFCFILLLVGCRSKSWIWSVDLFYLFLLRCFAVVRLCKSISGLIWSEVFGAGFDHNAIVRVVCLFE